MKTTPRISAVLITRNEEANVSGCLESVAWCDEIVVVDSASADRTVELCRKHTDKIITMAWSGSYGVQRNAGLDAATGDWVLMIDADELVPEGLRAELSAFASSPGAHVGAYIPRRNFFFGRWLRHGGCYPDLQMRFFRRDRCRYHDGGGEGPDAPRLEGSAAVLREPMLHYTGLTISERLRKMEFESTLQARQKVGRCKRVGWSALISRPLASFARTYLGRSGYRDGTEGLLFAVLFSFQNFVTYAKIREMQIRAEEGDSRTT